jgi:hypothetical protein
MTYRAEATTLVGFVQQLAANILPHGYWFYVQGRVPLEKDPVAVDAKLIAKYGVNLSRQQRARRKQAGVANIHYLRHGQFWLLMATKGEHLFFVEEASSIRDVRRTPILAGGYSLCVKQGGFLKKSEEQANPTPDGKLRVRVQINREAYRDLKGYFLEVIWRQSGEEVGRELFNVPFEPYAPIRRQLLNLLRLVNEKRQQVGLPSILPSVVRYRRQIVKPFEAMSLDVAA